MKKIVPYIPLMLMMAGLLYALYRRFAENVVLYWNHMLGVAFILVIIVLYLARQARTARWLTLTAILLGLFGIIEFFPGRTGGYMAINGVKVVIFHPYSLLLLLIFIVCNWEAAVSRLDKYRR